MDSLKKFIHLSGKLVHQNDISPPVIAIMGSFNTGKSTLINKLLNEQISPEGSLPKTSCFLYVKYGTKFTARVNKKGENIYFPSSKQLHFFLNNQLANRPQRIEITLNKPLLKKCILVDTPGIDGLETHTKELQKIAISADHIIYLFHQRGIDEFNKNFLTSLNKSKKINHRHISFWINCNLGKSDGTSLVNTSQALKRIFNLTPELYLINSHSPESITVLRQYIQISSTKKYIRELMVKHKKLDGKIPANLQKSMLIKNDSNFLDHFWRIKDEAEEIIAARRILNALPQVESKIRHLLAENQNKNLLQVMPGCRSQQNHTNKVNFLDIKKQMYNLAEKMMRDREIERLLPPEELGRWAGILKKEQFKVVAVGGFSSGKSTFFNAIMGETLLPAENRPTTASITCIEHGPHRKATITFKTSLKLKLCSYEGSSVNINQEGLQAVEEWLSRDSKPQRVTNIQADTGQGLLTASRQKILQELQQTRKLFSAGIRNGKLDQRAPGTLFRSIPVWKAKTMRPVWKINLTFAPAAPIELDLETRGGRKKYVSLTTSSNALRIKNVHIQHPHHFFKLAAFIDTPGLDSTNQQHTVLTTDFLQHSDAYLLFLNGKHLLSKNDSAHLLEIFKKRWADYLTAEKKQQQGDPMTKFFFVINFADRLTRLEKEKAKNYLHQNISRTLKECNLSCYKPQIFLISPLLALQGRDLDNFNQLLGAIQAGIWNYRGKDFLVNHLHRLRSSIEMQIQPGNIKNTSNYRGQIMFTKFSMSDILSQGIQETKDLIGSSFASVLASIDRFKQTKQFKIFAGADILNQEQPVTPIKKYASQGYTGRHGNEYPREYSYFRWINNLNHKISRQTSHLQKTIYRSVDTWLHRNGIKTNPYCLAPNFTGASASGVIEQLGETLSSNRNFYGGFNTKKTKFELALLVKDQEQKFFLALDRWQKEMDQYLRDLITPGLAAVINKPQPQNILVRQVCRAHQPESEIKALKKYLAQIKEIEKTLHSSLYTSQLYTSQRRGHEYGKRQGPK